MAAGGQTPGGGNMAVGGAGPERGAEPPAPERVLFPPTFSVSEIKNKQRRHFMFVRWKQQQRKVGQAGGRARRAGGQAWAVLTPLCPRRRSWPSGRSGGRSEKPSETR